MKEEEEKKEYEKTDEQIDKIKYFLKKYKPEFIKENEKLNKNN